MGLTGHRLKDWRKTVDELVAETGVSLEDVCNYIGSVYNKTGPSFYVKLPRKRSVFIGVGMAFGQPVEVINEWITGFAGKRKLYAKDISGDLVWIYLINANYSEWQNGEHDAKNGYNYYQHYEDFQAAAYAVFRERWDEIILRYEDTSDIEVSLGQAEFGPEFDGLKEYVAAHMDAFKTAYSKPRSYLDMYVERIIMTCRNHPGLRHLRSINAMRGYLDDSMINFLSGTSNAINVIDLNTGKRTVNIKHVPKKRSKYIEMGIALGMTESDLNELLTKMGYAPLDGESDRDSELLTGLRKWEKVHPMQRKFKDKYFGGDDLIRLTEEEEHQAVEEMLHLSSEMRDLVKTEK